VNLETDLLAGDDRAQPHTVTLLANSTYVFQDERSLQAGRIVFSTSGAATAVAQRSGGSPASSSGDSTISQGVNNVDVVGSEIARSRGTLSAGVTTAGKLTLTFKGKGVSALRSGKYRIMVLDETASSGFTLQKLGRQALKLTGLPFVGRKTVSVTLNPGQWMFYSSPAKKNYFVVTR
jgi:hypothetical protein